MNIDEQTFAALCFIVLMDHHGNGYQKAHPSWIEEKMVLLERGYEAYAALDPINQTAVIDHLHEWGYEVPKPIKKYEADMLAVFGPR